MDSTQQAPVNAFYGNADGSAENADTHITINQPPRGSVGSPVIAPFQPVLATQPAQPVERTPLIEDNGRIGSQEIADTKGAIQPQSTTTTTKTTVSNEKQINWGGIAKGAVIVGAVVLVGVVAFTAGSALVGAALGNASVASLAASTQAVVTPVATAVGSAASWATGFLSNGIGIASSFIGGITGTTGAAFTAGAATQSAAGYLIGGGAVAAAAPTAIHALGDIHVVNTANVAHHTTTITPDHTTVTQDHASTVTPDAPAQEHSNIFSDLFASKSAIVNTHAMESGAHGLEHMEHTQHSAVELGHHSTHTHEPAASTTDHYTNHSELADSSEDNKAHRKSWMDRVAGNRPRPAIEGNFASTIANKAPTPITSRGTNFSQALDNDRAKLDASLAESTR